MKRYAMMKVVVVDRSKIITKQKYLGMNPALCDIY